MSDTETNKTTHDPSQLIAEGPHFAKQVDFYIHCAEEWERNFYSLRTLEWQLIFQTYSGYAAVATAFFSNQKGRVRIVFQKWFFFSPLDFLTVSVVPTSWTQFSRRLSLPAKKTRIPFNFGTFRSQQPRLTVLVIRMILTDGWRNVLKKYPQGWLKHRAQKISSAIGIPGAWCRD